MSGSGILERSPTTRRLVAAVVGGLMLLLLMPLPAGADPARPTNYVSEVTSVVPDAAGLHVEVVGGDSFLVVEVAPGTTLEVPGYEGEDYLTVTADGEVRLNLNSPSHWVNEDRFGQVAVPAGAAADAPPDWVTVATDGTYGWHDHRIHWMSPEPPPAVDRSRPSHVFDWIVPIVVDGQETQISGTLQWLPTESGVVGLVVAALIAMAAYRFPQWVLLGAGVLAMAVGLAQAIESPMSLSAEAFAWLPPVVALGAVTTGLVWRRNPSVMLGLAAVILIVWGAYRFGALWLPVLPSPLPTLVERLAVAASVGGAVGALVGVYRRLGPGTPPPASAH